MIFWARAARSARCWTSDMERVLSSNALEGNGKNQGGDFIGSEIYESSFPRLGSGLGVFDIEEEVEGYGC